jgi:hypothetical protein
MTREEIDNIFTYHPPFGDQTGRYERIRRVAREFAYLLNADCPESREKSISFTHLQICVQMANAAIAINEKPRGGESAAPA